MADYKKVESDIKEKLVAINRITKVVKGGRRFGFAALMVVGNQKGSIGIGQGKSKQVPDAIKKATEDAKRNLTKIPLKEGRTLHHDVNFKISKDIKITVEKQTIIKITGVDKELVSKTAADIKNLKPVEPYKGKGIKERGQFVLRKEGKKK